MSILLFNVSKVKVTTTKTADKYTLHALIEGVPHVELFNACFVLDVHICAVCGALLQPIELH